METERSAPTLSLKLSGEGISAARWIAAVLLIGTGFVNLWMNWTSPTPWALDCCFGAGDGQPLGLPVALIHVVLAAVVVVPMRAVLGTVLGIAWGTFSAMAWAFLTVWLFLIKQDTLVSLPSRANGSWAELLIAPAMLVAYLTVVALLWTEVRRASTSR